MPEDMLRAPVVGVEGNRGLPCSRRDGVGLWDRLNEWDGGFDDDQEYDGMIFFCWRTEYVILLYPEISQLLFLQNKLHERFTTDLSGTMRCAREIDASPNY